MRRAPKKREQQQIGVPEVIRVQITMADRRVLTTWSPMEVHAVIRYEWARGTNVSVIHERLQTVYGEEVNAEVEQAVRKFLASQVTEFYHSGFFKLIARCDKCLNVGGD